MVYLPSQEAKAGWTKAAKKWGSVSQMVFELVREGLREKPTGLDARASSLEREVETLAAKAAGLEREVESLRVLNGHMEREIAEYRARAFASPPVLQKLDPRLIRLLSEARDAKGHWRPVGEAELRQSLQFGMNDPAVNAAPGRQLVFLEAQHVVAKTPQGWVWNG